MLVKIADYLRPDDFYKDAHRAIFELCLELWDRREPIDILSLSNYLEERKLLDTIGGRGYLGELSSIVATASNAKGYADIIKRKALLRELIKSSTDIIHMSYEEGDEAEYIVDRAEQRLFSVAQRFLKQNFIPIQAVLEDAFERIEEIHRGDTHRLRGIPTHFADLDNVIAGLQKSDLVILAARPSLGKSSLALDVVRHIATIEKTPVGIFSLEMSKEQIVDRLICAEAGINLWKMRTGFLSQEEGGDFSKIGQAIASLSEAPIFIDDSPMSNILEVKTKARRLKAEHNLGLLVIDYLQLMEGSARTENRVQEVSEISRMLKALARELNIPVLALSQLSRSVEMRVPAIPKLADLRESGCLAGDTVIMQADTGELTPIKELVGKNNIPVFSLNQNRQLEIRTISKIFSSGKKQLFELKTGSGRTIKASSNHPFLTVNGWQRVDELSIGKHLALPRILTPQSIEQPVGLSDNELILLAHLIGDGCVLPTQPIHYTSADEQNIKIVSDIAHRLFNISPRIIKQKNWFHVYLPSPYHLTHKRHHPIINWLHSLELKPVRSYEKILPRAIFLLSQDHIRLFLHHLWSTDGNISWKKIVGRKPSAAIYYATTSKTLAEQIQHLLLRQGILNTVRTVPQRKRFKEYRPNYQIHIEGSGPQLKFCNLIGSYGSRGVIVPQLIKALEEIKPNPNLDIIPQEAWKTYIEPAKTVAGLSWRDVSAKIQTAYCGSTLFQSGLSRERMGRVAEALHANNLFSLAESDIYWDKIIAITPLGIEEVFDATVPETHNFIANDFIVHNSIEQDADVVMFIYRKAMDRGVKHFPEEERNIAEIHIAKHRHGPAGVTVNLYFDEHTASFRNLETKIEEPF